MLTFGRVCRCSLVAQSKVWVVAAGSPSCRHKAGQAELSERSTTQRIKTECGGCACQRSDGAANLGETMNEASMKQRQ